MPAEGISESDGRGTLGGVVRYDGDSEVYGIASVEFTANYAIGT
jgi:hypothetical protein